ncbi:hypothetical protein AB8B21_05495 [Tardiphaga sp. 866_E4_N2_1]|uniref:hypothetical protein n=1 Tax=unclassified Tardiphaga TaxID=2631404 RepID=UPI003F280012
MIKLTPAQISALNDCNEAGSLWRKPENYWRWLRTLPNGQVYMAASNPTIFVLRKQKLLRLSSEHEVKCTDAGRAALAEGGAK